MNEKNSINLRGHCLYYLMFSILNFVVKNIFTFCDCFRWEINFLLLYHGQKKNFILYCYLFIICIPPKEYEICEGGVFSVWFNANFSKIWNSVHM